jgi:TrmH family RNA methyltransferase
MPQETSLRNISIVLVNTKTPGNIGAVARCMMNTGLSRLVLVRPPLDRNGEALKLAAGAESILKNAEVFPTLQESIAGHGLVIGTSRHRGKQRKNLLTPREMAETVVPLLAKNRVAIVFGREVNGLDREDLSLCHELVCIPSSDAFPSLNLSHAVMVVVYELFLVAATRLSLSDRRTGSI